MKNIIFIFIAVFLFFNESKAQFNSSKYDYSYEKYNQEIKIYQVKLNNKWGIVDSKGKELIPIEYDEIKDIIKGVNEINPLLMVVKDNFSGVLSLKNTFVVPLSDWNRIYESGHFIMAKKNAPISPIKLNESETYDYNYLMDSTYLFNKTGDLIMITDELSDFKSFDVDSCITKNIYFTAVTKKNSRNYSMSDYDFFIIEPGERPKKLFEYCRVELWPDKMFYVEKRIRSQSVNLEDRNNQPIASFYSLQGNLLTTSGDYTEICCKNMYPRYEAEAYGKRAGRNNSYERGLKFIIDSSGNKLSEGYYSSMILGREDYDEEGYFYKIYKEISVTPLCQPILSKNSIPNNSKTLPNNSKIIANKTTLQVKSIEPLIKINKYEEILLKTKKLINQDYLESYMNFEGKNITGWYKYIISLPGEYYDKAKNLVFIGGNLLVTREDLEGGNLLRGIFNLIAEKEVLPTKYDEISFVKNGIYKLKFKDKYGLWFQKDNFLIEPIYDEIDEYPSRVKLNGKWGKVEKSAFVPF
jgi:hypothetical protein